MTTDDDDRTLLGQAVDQAADLFVYAPIGLFFEGPEMLPKLAEHGRVHTRNARMLGQLAVRHGEAEVKRRLGTLEEQAVGLLRLVGLADEPPAPPAEATRPTVDPVVAAPTSSVSGNGQAAASPAVDELAITDYDSLSASQVVTRLEGLTVDELESVRAYEATHRGRKTILNKVAQLQA